MLFVEDTPASPYAADWAIKLSQRLSARVFALGVIPVRTTAVEENTWRRLYEVEDAAFEQNVRVSLLLETGDPLQRLCALSASYQIELLVVSADTRLRTAELIRHSPGPVVFVKPPQEESQS